MISPLTNCPFTGFRPLAMEISATTSLSDPQQPGVCFARNETSLSHERLAMGLAVVLGTAAVAYFNTRPATPTTVAPAPRPNPSSLLSQPRFQTTDHEVLLAPDLTFDGTTTSLALGLTWQEVSPTFRSAVSQAAIFSSAYLHEKFAAETNPMEPFRTTLRLDPKLQIIATPSLSEWMAANKAMFQKLDLSDVGDVDAMTLVGITKKMDEETVVLMMVYDLNALIRTSAGIAKNPRDGLFATIFASAGHELTGHLTRIVNKQQGQDRKIEEVAAFTRSVDFLNWVLQKTRDEFPPETRGRFEALLVRERKFLRNWKETR